jgi:hypothetical protein
LAIRDWLAGGRNVTAGWVRDPSLRLTLDFSTGMLCGVGLGEPVERLSFLGPTDRRPKPDHDLEFLALGLSVGLSGDKIDSYSVWWRDDPGAGYQPYPGSVLLQNQRTSLGKTTQEPEILTTLGPPYWRDQDDSETILFYELRDSWGGLTERQLELDGKGALKSLLVCCPPMLAEESQRRAYGVDKPWPPSF